MHDTDVLRQLMLAVSRLAEGSDQQMRQAEQFAESVRQLQATQLEWVKQRQVEEGHFRQAMVQLFAEQQDRTEAALRPVIGKTWWGLVTVAAGFVLFYIGAWLLVDQQLQRLEEAQARADAAQVSAEVQQASQHVRITSCGGRACIAIDKNTPTWKSNGKEYVLVDGRPAD
ncbi:hypothetical protein [Pseudoxanthomonas dokdonensis]|uniref:Uncharacterized protein n=1 Tax=Pseudoxanthomonas dokdonensis TaxID=344882 RepID=A0A0R0CX36_9GAMM|nr:hypothetical protein [Pseudoxanthomonas dokdonensis]KRG71074.1 hypothetical protein ABB29_04450 [Pseudoxanthomonas dokdonensis]